MHRIGVSFQSQLSPDEVQSRFIQPLRQVLEAAKAGIYSNYLRQVDEDSSDPAEHLLVFEVRDFKEGLRLLRTEIEKLGPPERTMLHNLNPSKPAY